MTDNDDEAIATLRFWPDGAGLFFLVAHAAWSLAVVLNSFLAAGFEPKIQDHAVVSHSRFKSLSRIVLPPPA